MYQIDLQAIPNQELSVTIDTVPYTLHIFDYGGGMAVDVYRSSTTALIQGARIVAGWPLIPFTYLEDASGNFIITTQDNELPYYDEFGVSQFLIFATNSELEAIRSADS